MSDADPVLTTGQVAELFGVTAQTVHAWTEAGKLPHFRTPGGQRRFRRSEVEALLEPVDGPDSREAVATPADPPT